MTRATLYGRVSGNDQAKTGGENLQDQLRLCREHAREKGYKVVAELSEDDRGASGATFDLPKLSEVLELARAGKFDVLIVRELDRLSRDLAKQLIVEQELKRAGVSIEYVLYDFPDTPEGRLNKNLRAMLAEYEREKIKQRMVRGRKRRAKAGHLILHGNAPYGYRKAERDGETVLEIVEEEAAVIRNMFQWYTVGDESHGPMGAPAIAVKLTAEAVPTWADIHNVEWMRRVRPSGGWCFSVVRKMLANETYAGTFRYGEEQIPISVPAIVDRETWKAAQRQAGRNKSYAKRNTKYEYLLQYRLRCGECDRAMRVKANPRRDGQRMKYYTCAVQDDRTLSCPNHHHYRADDVDITLWEWLRDQLSNPGKLEKSLREYQAQREERLVPLREKLAAAKELIQKTTAKRARLLDHFLDGLFEREFLAERKQQYDDELARLEERRMAFEQQIEQDSFSEERLQAVLRFARTIGSGLEEADTSFSKRRALLETLEITCVLSFREQEQRLEVYGALNAKDLLIGNPNTSIRVMAFTASGGTLTGDSR